MAPAIEVIEFVPDTEEEEEAQWQFEYRHYLEERHKAERIALYESDW